MQTPQEGPWLRIKPMHHHVTQEKIYDIMAITWKIISLVTER